MFNKKIYIERRNSLINSIKSGILLFLGNDVSPMNYYDNQFNFRQDSSFLYFFGFQERPGIAATIDVENGDVIIFADEDPFDNIVWTGPTMSAKDEAALAGIEKVKPFKELYEYIKKAKSLDRAIHYIPPYRKEHNILISELLNIPISEQNKNASTDFILAIANLRNHKSDIEIAEIEKAVNISYKMHTEAMKCVQPGMHEYDVMSVIYQTALKSNCTLSFPIICTTHGETLHNHSYTHKLEKGNMMLVDAGAELPNGYCGDLSSTFPVFGKFSERQKTIYDIVASSHKSAVDALRPGIPFKEVYYKSCAAIVDGMKGLGMMKGDTMEAVHAGAHALFFQCGLGHMMGLDVHDMENLGEVWVGYNGEPKSTQFGMKSLRLGRTLEPGFVLTIEPGVYFISELIDLWKGENKFSQFINYNEVEKWRGFGGIRNEEDYLITPTGKRILGDPTEKKEIVERFF